jgi:uncharacterized protein (TIGR00369 family)
MNNPVDNQVRIDQLNAMAPSFIKMLGGKIVAVSPAEVSCAFEFDVTTDFCHSVDVVQGGFVTAMLDAAMSHAVFAAVENIASVSSLEIKTSYLAPTRAGYQRVVGKVIKSSYQTAFLEGQIYNAEGLLTATASSVAKLVRAA